MNWLKKVLTSWLLADLDGRVKDLERHFVTQRNEQGMPTETLADVPLAERKDRNPGLRGLSIAQRRAWLEATDGGRRVNG